MHTESLIEVEEMERQNQQLISPQKSHLPQRNSSLIDA